MHSLVELARMQAFATLEVARPLPHTLRRCVMIERMLRHPEPPTGQLLVVLRRAHRKCEQMRSALFACNRAIDELQRAWCTNPSRKRSVTWTTIGDELHDGNDDSTPHPKKRQRLV
jgi:hypothetical protein